MSTRIMEPAVICSGYALQKTLRVANHEHERERRVFTKDDSMTHYLGYILVTAAMLIATPARAKIVLVEGGQVRGVIILEDPESAFLRLAAEELQTHVRMASGVVLPIATLQESEKYPPDWSRLHIGPNSWTQAAGVQTDDLKPEHYRIRTIGNHIVFVGHDVRQAGESPLELENSPATFWAVGYLLDHELGVRWLWPGDLGTYVPKQETIAVDSLDVTAGPHGVWREFVSRFQRPQDGEPRLLTKEQHERLVEEGLLWKKRHQMAIHVRLPFGHAFNEWWDRYASEHPDYFATPPDGGPRMPWPRAERVKLRQGNPAVVDQIVREWRAAGSPIAWGVAPTDGTGFCTHPSSRAMDVGPAVHADPHDIWEGRVNLTPRFVKFWTQILQKMHAENPDAVLCTYAYGPYTEPPTGNVDFRGKLMIGIVNNYWDEQGWRGWSDAGAKLFLRPNWWLTGAGAPHLPLHMQAEYVRSIHRSMELVGYHYDSLVGHWGTQGPLYYASARLAVRPDLTVDQVLDEYIVAFGKAAPAVRDYLAYWEAFDREAAMGVIQHPGGWEGPSDRGLFEKISRQHRIRLHPLVGSYLVMPYLFTDDVIRPAQRILAGAEALVSDDPVASERVRFLRDGLQHAMLTRDVIKYAYGETKNRQKHTELAAQLQALRRELTPRHVVWGEQAYVFEWRRRIATDRWHQRYDR